GRPAGARVVLSCGTAATYLGVARSPILNCSCFCFMPPASTAIYTLSLHDALPISFAVARSFACTALKSFTCRSAITEPLPESRRSEEHTSELQSRRDLVCRLLLEKKKNYSLSELDDRYATADDWAHKSVAERGPAL